MQRRLFLKGALSSAVVLQVSGAGIVSAAESIASSLPEGSSRTGGSTVINAGIGGDNTEDLLARMEKDCLGHRPELTVLMIGTNDMNSRKHVPLPAYEENLARLVREIKSKGSEVLLMTILPAYEPYLLTRHPAAFYEPERPSGRRNQVNAVIKKVAAANKVHLLDIGKRFEVIGKIGTDKDSLIKNEANSNKTDGIHPTPNGYRFIALAVYDYIVYNGLPTIGIVCFGDSITYGDGPAESYPGYLDRLLRGDEGAEG